MILSVLSSDRLISKIASNLRIHVDSTDEITELSQAFERVSRTCYGYTNIADVGDIQSAVTDKMESFFLAGQLFR